MAFMRGYWNDDFLGNRIELDLAYVKKTNEGSKFFAILGWIQRKSNVWYKSVIFSNLLLSYNSIADNEKKVCQFYSLLNDRSWTELSTVLLKHRFLSWAGRKIYTW